MNHHTVEHFGRREEKKTVEAQISFAAAAAPFRVLCADRDLSVRYPAYFRVIIHAFRNDFLCLSDKVTERVFVKDTFFFGLTFCFFISGNAFSYPILVLLDKRTDLVICSPARGTDYRYSVSDFQCERFPAAPDYFVFQDSNAFLYSLSNVVFYIILYSLKNQFIIQSDGCYPERNKMDISRTLENLQKHGFCAKWFETKEAARDYLYKELENTSIGFGGSVTAQQMGLYETLSEKNEVFWHWYGKERIQEQINASHAKVYILSANALSETGEIVNIDGNGNRLASMLYGHDRVIFVIGKNKITEDLSAAIERARNVASPLNAKRLNRNTPCAKSEELKCFNCNSPERICSGMAVLFEKMGSIPQMDVLLIGEDLGY